MKIFPSYFQKCRRFKDIKYDKYDTERSHKMCHKKVSQKRVPKKYPKKSVRKMYGDSGKSGAFGESGQTLCTNICNINGMAWEVANGAIFKQLPVLATCHSIDGEAYTCSRMSSSLKTGKNKRDKSKSYRILKRLVSPPKE